MIVSRCGDAVALGNAAAARAVHADGMDLVEIGQRVVLVGEVADRGDRRDVAVHRIDALEGDQLGRFGIGSAASSSSRWARSLWRKTRFSQPELRMPAIIEAWLSSSEKMMQPGSILAERRQRRLVRDIARGEQQRAFLAVQVGQLGLEIDMIMGVAADVAGAARAGADIVQRLLHRRDHLGMLAHREIVVRAPDGDRLGPVMAGEAARVGKCALVAQDVDEHAIAALGMEPIDRLGEDALIVQLPSSLRVWPRLYRDIARLSSASRLMPSDSAARSVSIRVEAVAGEAPADRRRAGVAAGEQARCPGAVVRPVPGPAVR